MQGMPRIFGVFNGLDIGGIFEEAAVFNVAGYARQVLKHHPARAYIGVSHLGVPHLSLGKTYVYAGGREAGGGICGKQSVDVGSIGKLDGVARPGGGQAEAVHDYENRFFIHLFTP